MSSSSNSETDDSACYLNNKAKVACGLSNSQKISRQYGAVNIYCTSTQRYENDTMQRQ